MHKLTITICIVCIFLSSTSVLARVGVHPEGHWPKSWPEELEPYRKQTTTYCVALFSRALTVEEIAQLYNMTGTNVGTE